MEGGIVAVGSKGEICFIERERTVHTRAKGQQRAVFIFIFLKIHNVRENFVKGDGGGGGV